MLKQYDHHEPSQDQQLHGLQMLNLPAKTFLIIRKTFCLHNFDYYFISASLIFNSLQK